MKRILKSVGHWTIILLNFRKHVSANRFVALLSFTFRIILKMLRVQDYLSNLLNKYKGRSESNATDLISCSIHLTKI